jgi:hypothetical protein
MRRILAAAATLAVAWIAVAVPARAEPAGPKLAFPLACKIGRTCEVQNYVDRDPGPAWADYHCGHRSYDGHTGTDIRVLDLAMQRRGVDVLAAAPGKVLRLRDGVPDILLKDMNQPHDDRIGCGNAVVIDHGDGWITAYCHMMKGSVRVTVGQAVAAGEPIGKVGLSGDTQFPHLHIEVRHDGAVVDPFAPAPLEPGACAAKDEMWDAAAASALVYKRGAILNAGLASGRADEDSVETGGVPGFDAAAEVITPYMRAIDLEAGDVMQLTFTTPGQAPKTVQLPALTRNAAQPFLALSRRRPPAGWPKGDYIAEFKVIRAGKAVLERRVEAKL